MPVTAIRRMTKEEEVREMARQAGILRSRDLLARGIPLQHLKRLADRGELERLGRGLYRLPQAELTEHHDLAEVARRVPHGVVCLLSALEFHGLTTQSPWQVWLMIEGGAWRPRPADGPPLVIVRASGEAFHAGVEGHVLEGVPVRITNVAKTVADCFKYRGKVGLDVALEALKDCLQQRRATRGELRHFARLCRVQNVMRPYLEALSA